LKILLIEDDNDTASYVARALRKTGHSVDRAHNGNLGLFMARTQVHDVAIVDRMIPGTDGLTLVKELREEEWPVPVLFLTTMTGISDRVQGLEAGGDDYLTKPFAIAELIARVDSLARRPQRAAAEKRTRIFVGDLEIDLIERTVRRAGRPITLQAQEFLVLEYLARHAGQVVTRTMLLENVWQMHFDPHTNIVESHLSRIRAKLDRPFGEPMIHTVRGVGYLLRAA
jgi:two-component system OmpR family response regulator